MTEVTHFMIALLQRVTHAVLRIDGEIYSEIGPGLVVLLGLEQGDTATDGHKLLAKVCNYRIFADDEGRMNRSVVDIGGEILLVSQFTLAAATHKGLRPSFTSAMAPAPAELLYDELVSWLRETHPATATGRFGADMKILLENDGPVTFLLNTQGSGFAAS